jgi:hypothetical protein
METIAPLSDDPTINLPALAGMTDPAHAGDRGDTTQLSRARSMPKPLLSRLVSSMVLHRESKEPSWQRR